MVPLQQSCMVLSTKRGEQLQFTKRGTPPVRDHPRPMTPRQPSGDDDPVFHPPLRNARSKHTCQQLLQFTAVMPIVHQRAATSFGLIPRRSTIRPKHSHSHHTPFKHETRISHNPDNKPVLHFRSVSSKRRKTWEPRASSTADKHGDTQCAGVYSAPPAREDETAG